MTFDQFVDTEQIGDLDQFGLENATGYIYLDAYFIAEYDFRRDDPDDLYYIVMIGNIERKFTDLDEAQHYLWDDFVDPQVNKKE